MNNAHAPEVAQVTDDDAILARYREKKQFLDLFLKNVHGDFATAPRMNIGTPCVIHSLRSRLKDEEHLREKIARKRTEGKIITVENLFTEITDLAGLRVLHLYQNQFSEIHAFIKKAVKEKRWRLIEKPIAYTWDPESVEFFKGFGLTTNIRASYYTSAHYLIAPANDTENLVCEIQVRTLFEEAWGEIDHSINYPNKTTKLASIEQLRVLSKLVSTGSRLADAIFKVHNSKD